MKDEEGACKVFIEDTEGILGWSWDKRNVC